MSIVSYPEGIIKGFEEHNRKKEALTVSGTSEILKTQTFPIDEAIQAQINIAKDSMEQIMRNAYILIWVDYVNRK